IDELKMFAAKLDQLSEERSLTETQKILEELFGERPARSVVKDYVDRLAQDIGGAGGRYLPGKASIPAAVVGASTVASNVRMAPSHKFFGDHPDELAKRR